MNKILILLVLIFFLLNKNIYSQSEGIKAKYRELEVLERMETYLENNRAKEKKAENIILGYYYDVKDEIRKKRGKISEAEYERINSFNKEVWNIYIVKVLKRYRKFSSYLYANEKTLKDYRELTLDRLYSYEKKQKNNHSKYIEKKQYYDKDIKKYSTSDRDFLYKSKTYSFAPIFSDVNLENKLYTVKNDDYIYIIKKIKKGVYKIRYLDAFGYISEGMLKNK